MTIKDLTTDLEDKLYVSIIGRKQGLEAYFKGSIGEGWEELNTYKEAKIQLALLTELSKIIEDEK